MIHVYYTCKKCQCEIEVEVIIGEENDLPEECPECGATIPESAHQDVEESAYSKIADHFEKDR